MTKVIQFPKVKYNHWQPPEINPRTVYQIIDSAIDEVVEQWHSAELAVERAKKYNDFHHCNDFYVESKEETHRI